MGVLWGMWGGRGKGMRWVLDVVFYIWCWKVVHTGIEKERRACRKARRGDGILSTESDAYLAVQSAIVIFIISQLFLQIPSL